MTLDDLLRQWARGVEVRAHQKPLPSGRESVRWLRESRRARHPVDFDSSQSLPDPDGSIPAGEESEWKSGSEFRPA